MELPLSVALAALIKDDKILLIKRARGSYSGLWGLPGGKIERDEHVNEAAIREIKEECGIETKFKSYLGLISEHLVENRTTTMHFLLHVCELETENISVTSSDEGEVKWFATGDLIGIKREIIPSDFLIMEKMVLQKKRTYYDCVLEKSGDNYKVKKFE
ncbi:MAG: NUDIX hydrolase [Candidatus Aenigmarchaeota archaeon]|nr:NUDIX hydrolase [Candidatus Aenigmarchaeota archaeon]